MADDSLLDFLTARVLNILQAADRPEGMTAVEIDAKLRSLGRWNGGQAYLVGACLENLEQIGLVKRRGENEASPYHLLPASPSSGASRGDGPPPWLVPPVNDGNDGPGFGDVLAHPHLFVLPRDDFDAAVLRAVGEQENRRDDL